MRISRLTGLLALALGASLLLPLTGCRKVPPKHSGELEEGARPLALWEVSKGGESDYLFGTCHVGVALDEALPPSMADLVTGSDLFVMEADMSEMRDPEVVKRLLLPEGTTLETLLGAEVWQRVVDEFDLGAQASGLVRVHPFALVAFAVQKMAAENAGPGTVGAGMMDLSLAGRAQSAGVKAGYLETANEQLDLFLERDIEVWLSDVRDLLEPGMREEMREQLALVLGICRQSDWSGALAYLAQEREEDGDWQQKLLLERNENWIPRLQGFFEEGQVFVAAGAGHMVGPGSVVELLRAAGYKVRQMSGVTVPQEQAETGERTDAGGARVPRDAFVGIIGDQLPPLICVEGSQFMTCFGDATARCVEEVAVALPICADEVGLPDWIEGADGREWGGKLGECIGMKAYAALSDVLVPGPGCPESVTAGDASE